MPLDNSHAEVVGAGIGGLTAAAALARRGWSVTVHERDEAVRAFGSGTYLWGNGLGVLDDLGVLERAVEGAHRGPSIQTRDHRNRVLAQLPTNGPGQVQGRLNDVPDLPRRALLSALGRSRSFGRSRLRAANAVATGAGGSSGR